jgi:hypothetical protein
MYVRTSSASWWTQTQTAAAAQNAQRLIAFSKELWLIVFCQRTVADC